MPPGRPLDGSLLRRAARTPSREAADMIPVWVEVLAVFVVLNLLAFAFWAPM